MSDSTALEYDCENCGRTVRRPSYYHSAKRIRFEDGTVLRVCESCGRRILKRLEREADSRAHQSGPHSPARFRPIRR